MRKETARAWKHKGALAFNHDTEKALNAYRKALSLASDDIASWNQTGHLLFRLGEIDQAIEAYEKVGELADGGETLQSVSYGNLGNVYQTQGDLDKAVEFLSEVTGNQ